MDRSATTRSAELEAPNYATSSKSRQLRARDLNPCWRSTCRLAAGNLVKGWSGRTFPVRGDSKRQVPGPEGQDAAVPFDRRSPQTRDGVGLKAGALLVREWKGRLERVMILEEGFAWNGQTFSSLSQIAKAMTGTNWNGHRFFGLRQGKIVVADEASERR